MTLTLESDSAEAYAVLAPAYDLLTAEYAYGPWLAAIERLALRHGLAGRRLLDVGCGTGKSFMPLLERGFDVTACDISPEMVAAARQKAGGRADVLVADMRRLPVLGEFDLITCIDDAINHLLGPDEVADAFAGLRANLAPGGLLVFDVNTLAAYQASRTSSSRTRSGFCAGAAAWPSSRPPAARPRWSSTSSRTRATGCGGAH
jgi:SAM-dependent methyltransferase